VLYINDRQAVEASFFEVNGTVPQPTSGFALWERGICGADVIEIANHAATPSFVAGCVATSAL